MQKKKKYNVTSGKNSQNKSKSYICTQFKLGEIKGLVHPKRKIKSLITHPHAVPTP